MIVYIVEDILHCIYKNRLITVKMKDCIQKGFIIDKEIFMQEFNRMIRKEKIKSKLFGDNITIVNNGYFKYSDLFFFENIFGELGFIKINFLDIRELLPVTNAIYIEVNNSYIILYLDDILYLDLKYFRDIPKTISFFKDHFDQDVAFFGLNKCIPDIHIDNVNTYYIENYMDYITQSLPKVKF